MAKTRVYISSTFADLQEYRAKVIEMLEKSGDDVECMEKYAAADERPQDKCRQDASSCDVYVCILAWRYGFIPKEDNPRSKSITELEYEAAPKGRRLSFQLKEDALWNLSFTDSHTNKGKRGKLIKDFRARVGDEAINNFFTTPDDLAVKVLAAVRKLDRSTSDEAGLMKRARRKFTVKRIRDPEDADLYAIWNLLQDQFSEETVDTYEDMKLWVAEINSSLREPEGWAVDEITLALKRGNDVVGYLFAQHYMNWKTIFLSHVGYDHAAAREAAHDGPAALLSELVKVCNEPSRPRWEYVLGEIEESKNGKNDHAYRLFVAFKRHAQLIDPKYQVFILEFDYIQPIVKPEDMDRGVDDAPARKQRLMLLVRDPTRVPKNSAGEFWLTGEEAVKLFSFVVSCLYAHGFPKDKKYQEYLFAFQARYKPRLKNGVRLIGDGRQVLRMLRG